MHYITANDALDCPVYNELPLKSPNNKSQDATPTMEMYSKLNFPPISSSASNETLKMNIEAANELNNDNGICNGSPSSSLSALDPQSYTTNGNLMNVDAISSSSYSTIASSGIATLSMSSNEVGTNNSRAHHGQSFNSSSMNIDRNPIQANGCQHNYNHHNDFNLKDLDDLTNIFSVNERLNPHISNPPNTFKMSSKPLTSLNSKDDGLDREDDIMSITTTIQSSAVTTPVMQQTPKNKNRFLKMLSRNSSPSKTHTPTIKELFFSTLQIAVSQNRRRFINNGFNLDLTYITDRIIAMGYPSTGAEEFYRNSMKSTREFLEMFHKGHYFVFNLRGNYLYDRANFDNRVAVYKMTDHHPPNLEMMAPFCKQVDEYMRKDPSNVIAVHCKAGKGRTGVMICAYLVHIDFFPNPRTCIDYYSCIRTKNNKGVTIPSQRRYVYYFDYLKKNKLPYEQLKIELVGIYIEKPPKLDSTSLVKKHFSLRIANKGKRVFEGLRFEWSNADFATEESQWNGSENRNGNDQYDQYNPIEGNDCISRRCFGWTLEPGERVHLEGDVRLDILCTSTLPFTRSQTKLCHLWFNTMFACPSFSKGYFMYGDEMFPYTDNLSELVKKVPVSKGESIRINKQNRPASGKENISVSPKKSPCTSKKLKMGKLFKGAKTEFIEDNSADPPTTSESGSKEESSPSKGKSTNFLVSTFSNALEQVSRTFSTNSKNCKKCNKHIFISPKKGSSSNDSKTSAKFESQPSNVRKNLTYHSDIGKPNDSTELKDINKSDLKKGSLTGKKDLINISPTNLNQSGPFIPGSATINKSIDFSVINREDSNVSSPCAESQLIKTLSLSEENLFPLNSAERYCACNLNIPEANRSEWVAAVPPGLEAHCPKETLSLIYKTNDENMAKPPRYQAAKFIKKAFDDDLINDDYNLSKNKEEKKRNTSNIVSKASLTHKKFGGPMCLMRKDGEHVQIYDAIQIDRAFKETHISKSFKVIVVTRCIRDNVSEGNHPSSSRCGGENYQSKENHPQQCKLHENRIPAYPTNQ